MEEFSCCPEASIMFEKILKKAPLDRFIDEPAIEIQLNPTPTLPQRPEVKKND
jgi:hypothetical protein